MVHRDEWLSKYFNGGAYRYDPPYEGLSCTAGFVFAKVAAEQKEDVNFLIKQGFEIIEVAILFEQQRMIEKMFYTGTLDFSTPQDEKGVLEIAKDAFTLSRFYQDSAISRELASQIKHDWVENYFKGTRGDHMIVAREKGEVTGFLLLIKNAIDLIAVSKNHMRKNIASHLIQFANQKVGLLRAGTQLINKPSIGLYERNGFALKQASFILHRHNEIK